MDDFPPICKQDPLEVRVMYMKEYFEMTGQTIKISDIPDEMYGGPLPIAKSRRSKKRNMTEAEYVEDATEKDAKKAKKSKATASQEKPVDPEVLTIQQEAQELNTFEVLTKRIRSKKQVDTAQSSKKRKMAIRKLRQASLAAEDELEEEATSLVTRKVLKKKALEIVAQISVPSNVLLQEESIKAAQTGIELTKDLQQLVASGELLKAPEEKATGSEAATSEAATSRGNPDVSNSAEYIEVESGSETSISSLDSSDLDDDTLSLIHKDLSPSTKPTQKSNTKPFEPVYLVVLKSIGEISQMRVDLCNKLPTDHPLQPPIIEPLNVAPTDTYTSTSTHSNQPSNSQPKSPTKTTEPNVLDQLVSHYFGELPEVASELHKASEVAFDEVTSESPQHQSPEPQIASTKIQITPEYVESTCTEEVSSPKAIEMEIDLTNSFSTSASNDMLETNIPTTTTPTQPLNNQPSSSHLAIQPITPPQPDKIPSPPTMYLDSSLLVDVCENIFQELNKLIQSRQTSFMNTSMSSPGRG